MTPSSFYEFPVAVKEELAGFPTAHAEARRGVCALQVVRLIDTWAEA